MESGHMGHVEANVASKIERMAKAGEGADAKGMGELAKSSGSDALKSLITDITADGKVSNSELGKLLKLLAELLSSADDGAKGSMPGPAKSADNKAATPSSGGAGGSQAPPAASAAPAPKSAEGAGAAKADMAKPMASAAAATATPPVASNEKADQDGMGKLDAMTAKAMEASKKNDPTLFALRDAARSYASAHPADASAAKSADSSPTSESKASTDAPASNNAQNDAYMALLKQSEQQSKAAGDLTKAAQEFGAASAPLAPTAKPAEATPAVDAKKDTAAPAEAKAMDAKPAETKAADAAVATPAAKTAESAPPAQQTVVSGGDDKSRATYAELKGSANGDGKVSGNEQKALDMFAKKFGIQDKPRPLDLSQVLRDTMAAAMKDGGISDNEAKAIASVVDAMGGKTSIGKDDIMKMLSQFMQGSEKDGAFSDQDLATFSKLLALVDGAGTSGDSGTGSAAGGNEAQTSGGSSRGPGFAAQLRFMQPFMATAGAGVGGGAFGGMQTAEDQQKANGS